MISERLRRHLARLATVITVLGSLMFWGAGAADAITTTKTIHQKTGQDGQTSWGCDGNANEWHWVITDVTSEASAPESITVTWNDTTQSTVTREKFTGHTAHYTYDANASDGGAHLADTVTPTAFTTIYASWSGQFNLSHGPCGQQSPPGHQDSALTLQQSSLCSGSSWMIQNPGTNNTITFSYTINGGTTVASSLLGGDKSPAIAASPGDELVVTYTLNGSTATLTDTMGAVTDGPCSTDAALTLTSSSLCVGSSWVIHNPADNGTLSGSYSINGGTAVTFSLVGGTETSPAIAASPGDELVVTYTLNGSTATLTDTMGAVTDGPCSTPPSPSAQIQTSTICTPRGTAWTIRLGNGATRSTVWVQDGLGEAAQSVDIDWDARGTTGTLQFPGGSSHHIYVYNGATESLLADKSYSADGTQCDTGNTNERLTVTVTGTTDCTVGPQFTVTNTGNVDAAVMIDADGTTGSFVDGGTIKVGDSKTFAGKTAKGFVVKLSNGNTYAASPLDQPTCSTTGTGGGGGETAPPTTKPTKTPTTSPTKVTGGGGGQTGGGSTGGGSTTVGGGGLAHTGASNVWQTVGGSMALIGFGALLLFGSRRSPVVARPRHH